MASKISPVEALVVKRSDDYNHEYVDSIEKLDFDAIEKLVPVIE